MLGGSEAPSRLSTGSWALIAAVVMLFMGGTAAAAVTRLRVPVRAQTGGWPYSYGFYEPEPDGAGGEFRWTGRRAVAVVDAPTHGMTVSASTNLRDLQTSPVDVKIWCDSKLVLQTRLTNTEAVTRFVRLPDSQKRVLIETWSGRVARPRDYGVPDDRELGFMMKWSFVDF
jgi:hypothetical protein